jgi:Holliday junction DNA helicase RuvA
MISHLHGVLRSRNEEEMSLEIEVGGVSYEVFLPMFVWRALEEVEPGSPLELVTLYHAAERQPVPKLIGFMRPVERKFFRKFMEVDGVGAAKALKALVFSVSTIARWIEAGDAASLGRLPGIGARSADKIVAHLKGKVVEEALLRDEGFEEMPEAAIPPGLDEVIRDAVEGLASLGYGRGEARRLVEGMVKEQALRSVEDIIRAVFRATQSA